MKYDFSRTKLRCHYQGDICQSEGKSGGLSVEAKKRLVEVYWEEKYDKKEIIHSKYFTRGHLGEKKAIELISITFDLHFEKNEETITDTNEYIKGTPDIYLGEEIRKATKVWDAKCSYSAKTFGLNVMSDQLNTDYQWQGHAYMALTGAKEFACCYCLVTASEVEINDAKTKLFYAPENTWVTMENPEYLEAAAGVELNMTFDDIEKEERILIFPIQRNESKIVKIYNKVEEARLFLAWYQDKHLTFNKSYIQMP